MITRARLIHQCKDIKNNIGLILYNNIMNNIGFVLFDQ